MIVRPTPPVYHSYFKAVNMQCYDIPTCDTRKPRSLTSYETERAAPRGSRCFHRAARLGLALDFYRETHRITPSPLSFWPFASKHSTILCVCNKNGQIMKKKIKHDSSSKPSSDRISISVVQGRRRIVEFHRHATTVVALSTYQPRDDIRVKDAPCELKDENDTISSTRQNRQQ